MGVLREFPRSRRKRIRAAGTSRHSKRSTTRLPDPEIRRRRLPCHSAGAPSSGSCRIRLDGLHKRISSLWGRSTRRQIRSWRDSCGVHRREGWLRARPGRRCRFGLSESPRRRASTQSAECSRGARLHSGGMPRIQMRSAPGEARRIIVFAAKNLPREKIISPAADGQNDNSVRGGGIEVIAGHLRPLAPL